MLQHHHEFHRQYGKVKNESKKNYSIINVIYVMFM